MLVVSKNSSMQVPEVSFNCHPDIMNTSSHVRSNAQSAKSDTLLVACKVQLSSEVIRWKTESLRLQKECNAAQQKGKELDQTVSKLVEKTKELETQLSQAKEENKHLRLKNVFMDDTKTGSMQRLSQSLNKYNSFPTASSLMNPLLGQSLSDSRQEELAVRQVSQEMFQQMKREMKELHEMNTNFFSVQDANEKEDNQTDCKEELEESISSLVSEASSLKNHLLEQQKKLHSLIRDYSKDFELKESTSAKRRDSNPNISDKHVTSTTKSPSSSTLKVVQKSLVEPLHNIPDLHIVRGPTNAWNFEDIAIHPSSNNRIDNYCLVEEDANTLVIQERICPMCEKQFDPIVPQNTFEEHVFEHLDAESESFLEQFVVL